MLGLWLSPMVTANRLRERYNQAQPGMTVAQVELLMNREGTWSTTRPPFPAWDDRPLPENEATRIGSVLRYTVSTYYLPITFEFLFDSNGKLIGRHIYD